MNLDRLLNPKSICVVGGREAAEVVRQCLRMGYKGSIYPVHPTRRDTHDVPCLRRLEDLPQAPDATFVGVRRELSVEVLDSLASMGAGGALCYASGFSEAGAEGESMQRALVEAAADMPFLGPNCYGFINYFDAAPLWPDEHGGRRVERGVALICQSSNIALNLSMQRRALPIGMLITLGNRARLKAAHLVDALLEDSRISAIGLVVETLDDADALARAALKAQRRGVSIVALKLGRSPLGAELTRSHTASLAGEDATASAFLERLGIARVQSISAFLEALKLLHIGGPVAGNQVVSLSCSGGEAALMADALSERDLDARPFSSQEKQRIASTLNDLVTISNPLDYHTFIWGHLEALKNCFASVLSCDFHLALLVLDLPRDDYCGDRSWQVTLQAFAEACRQTRARGCVLSTMPECMSEAHAEGVTRFGLTPLVGIEDGLDAIAALSQVREGSQVTFPPALLAGDMARLSEWQGKQWLRRAGVRVPEGDIASSVGQAVEVGESLDGPVVVKAVGQDIVHKTELGAVRLGVQSPSAIRAAASQLLEVTGEVLIEEMIDDGVAEVIVGVRRDAQFGLVLMIGAGGELTELMTDRALALIPALREEVAALLGTLKVGKLLDGYRGRPGGDTQALIDIVMKIQDIAVQNAEQLMELEVNPVIVRKTGAVAVDALLKVVEDAT